MSTTNTLRSFLMLIIDLYIKPLNDIQIFEGLRVRIERVK